ncbi:MAG: hypothetical protein RL432_142 [Bacteroidota bacterium]|jgi:hypothetical protein
MNGFKKCTNGHFFKEELPSCPYCPGGTNQINNDLSSTVATTSNEVNSTGNADLDRTRVVGSNEPASNTDKTNVAGVSSVSSTPKRDLNRTFIADVEETTTDRGEVKIESAPRSTRRIVGWIISYSLDPMGVDYRIFEGTNTIGRDSKNTIPITKDPTISGEHVIILYRNGKFKIKDKMTANGTFLNDVELEVEEAYDLGDGDVIRVGNTTFKFKSAES